jgi:hypothetical protein
MELCNINWRDFLSWVVTLFLATCTGSQTAFKPQAATMNLFAFDQPFEFAWHEGNPLDGYEVLKISSSGECMMTRRPKSTPLIPAPPYRSISFKISQEELQKLRSTLAAVGIPAKAGKYEDLSLRDGSQILMRLAVGEHEVRICCYNRFPSEIWRVRDYLETAIISSQLGNVEASRNNVSIDATYPGFECNP